MAVSFTQGNDFIVPTEDGQTYLGGAGNDTYMLSDATVAANSTIVIQDTEGTNTIQLVGGLSITSSQVTSNALELTLSNGAKVQILGADSFGYDVGGNALAGVDGTDQTFTELVENTLGTTVPAAGEAPTTGGTVEVPDATAPATPTFSVAASAASVTEGSDATFTVSLSAAQATSTTVDFALAGTGGAVLGTDTTTVADATLTFAPGEVSKTVTVPVTFDTETETGEGMTLTLSAPSTGTVLGTSSAAVDFVDPTTPTYTLTSDGATQNDEGDTVTFTVTPSGVVVENTTFTYSITGNDLGGAATAASAADFSAASGSITFASGDTAAQTVTVDLISGDGTESLEGYTFTLLDSTPAAVQSVDGQIIDSSGAGGTGQSYVMTTASDNLTGTANDDIFYGTADRVDPAKDTYQSADVVDGGAGTGDKLSVVVGADITATLPLINNIEILEMRSTAATGKIDASNTGLTKLSNNLSSANAEFANIGNVTNLAVSNTTSNTTFTYGASKLNTSTGTLNLELDAVGSATTSSTTTINVTTDVVTTLNVDAKSTSFVTTDNSAADPWATATKLNVTGAGGLTITGSAAGLDGLKTIDASANTGGVSVDLKTGANANAVTFTGGSGDDTIMFGAMQFTSLDSVNGGAGTGDIFSIADTSISATLLTDINAHVSNFEVIQGTGAGFTVDMSVFTNGIVDLNVGAAGAIAATNTLNTTNITVAKNVDNNASTMAITGKIGESTANIDLAGGVTTGTTTLTGLTTINIVSNGSSANILGKEAGDTTALVHADNVNFVVSGTQALELDTLAATTTGSKVDASALTGILTTYGSGKADILIGGSANDVISGKDGGDTMTGNAGADAFTVEITSAGTTAADFTAAQDIITDFVSGTDTLEFGGAAGSATNYVEATTIAASATAALSAADTALDGTVLYSVQQVGSDTYVYFDADGTIDTAGTEVVKLAGVTLDQIAMTDIL